MVVVALQAPLESKGFQLAVQASKVAEGNWIPTMSLPAREALLEAEMVGDSQLLPTSQEVTVMAALLV